MRARLLLAILFALLAAPHDAQAAFIRGSGKDLEICLSGEVLDADGRPATDVEIACRLNHNSRELLIVKPVVEGNRFEVWIPVNRVRWYSMSLKASSKQNDHVAYRQLAASGLRQAAIERLSLTLRPPTREVKISVIHNGQPAPGAMVKADVGYGVDLETRANDQGIAQLHLLPDQEFSYLTAWTDDFRMGGFSFNRDPPRDPNASEYVIELSKCRDQSMRFVDEQGAPVAGLPFIIQMATPPPNYNYLGTNEHSHLKTDASGEVVYRWFPDWEKHYFYADLETDDWVRDGDPETTGNVTVFKVKKARPRKSITGQITSTTSLGGFWVELSSFQGEQKRMSDMVWAFSDLDGHFTVDVLPDAHYCVFALDSQWVSNMTDLVPYDSASDHITPPQVEISAGQEVKIAVTVGAERRPYPNLGILLRRYHDYTWQEGNARKHGTGGPQMYVKTDEAGMATCHAPPGKLELNVYTPHWRTQESVEVRAGEPMTVELHRDSDEKRLVKGHIVLPAHSDQKFRDVVVQIGSIDGIYNDKLTVNCSEDGQFSGELFGSQVGIFAATADGKLAAGVHVKDLDAPIEVPLVPTIPFQGQILGDRKPLIGQVVHCVVRIEGEQGGRSPFAKLLDVKQLETRTDEQGNYTFYGMPANLDLLVYTASIDGVKENEYLFHKRFTPLHSLTRTVSKLQTSPIKVSDQPLAERFRNTLRDCAATGYRPLVVFYSGTARAAEFANDQFVDHDKNNDVYDFMQVVTSAVDMTAEDAAFVKEHDFKLPPPGHVTVYAFDSQGQPTGSLDVDVAAAEAAQAAAAFVKERAPKRADAQQKWNEAFAEAKRSHRRVLARVSQRYCGPCFKLARWLKDEEELLAKDFVLLKIDDYHDENGRGVAERLTRGSRHGIPFFGIFDEDEKLLVDSAGPTGNIGYPGSVEGQAHLRKMLLESRRNLSDSDVDALIGGLLK
ncbi:MAG TPA: thioredoxin family protein [Pirellulales bacterium]|nr:thioredoxin family protein [Pirellulales bacterium]